MWAGRRRIKYLIIKEQKYTFAFGTLIGAFLAVIVHVVNQNPLYMDAIWPTQISTSENLSHLTYENAAYDFLYETWLSKLNFQSCPVDPDLLRYSNMTTFVSQNCGQVEAKTDNQAFDRDKLHIDPRTEQFFLYENIDVACLVITKKDGMKATAIKDTWGQHCNSLKFVSSKRLSMHDSKAKSSILATNPATVEMVKASSEFGLLCKSLRQLYISRKDKLMWIVIGVEDLFMVLENLRFFVAPKNYKDTHYLGHAMKFWNVIYNWADAGYVLSRGTLDLFIEKFATDDACESGGKYWKNSDWYMGKHLASLHIHPVDTRDHIGRGRFIGHSLRRLLFPGGVSLFDRYWKDSLYLSHDGPHCCSNFAISFQLSASTTRMFQFYYFYYHLRTFAGGGQYGNKQAPQTKRASAQFISLDEKLKEEALDKIFFGKLTQH